MSICAAQMYMKLSWIHHYDKQLLVVWFIEEKKGRPRTVYTHFVGKKTTSPMEHCCKTEPTTVLLHPLLSILYMILSINHNVIETTNVSAKQTLKATMVKCFASECIHQSGVHEYTFDHFTK